MSDGGPSAEPGSDPPWVHIHYRRPPDREDVYVQRLVLDRPDVQVTVAEDMALDHPKILDGHAILEPGSSVVWFTFPGSWHDIGRFHDRNGRFTGLYANVITPVDILPEHVWRTTDLFLDVWRWPDGRLELLDVDHLRDAEARGWVAPELAARAHAEGARLLQEGVAGRWPPAVVGEWTLETARRVLRRV